MGIWKARTKLSIVSNEIGENGVKECELIKHNY